MLSMVEYVHERMHTYDNLEIGVDFTMGNGHDTKSLIECCKEVYSFDIQEEALKRTKELVGDQAHLIRDSHENFDHYVDTFDIGIFNLGYLPEGDHNITTTLDVTQRTLATVYKGNIIKNLIMDCQSYTKYRPNETTGGIFVSWRRKEELPTGA